MHLRLPTLLTEEEAILRIGGFTLVMQHSPGHSPDVITVLVREEKVLFASDTVMPVPYLVSGNIDDFRRSLQVVRDIMPVEDIVQGHGDVLLRGEVQTIIKAQVEYLNRIETYVADVLAVGGGKAELDALDLEACGLSRVALGGLVQQLHRGNLYYLYGQMRRVRQRAS